MLLMNEGRPDFAANTGAYSYLVWVIFVLIAIVALIVFLIRYLGKKNRGWFGGRSVRTLGGVGLGQNKSLQIVEIGGSVYLIGVGENISLIDKISEAGEVEKLIEALEQGDAGPNISLPAWAEKLTSRFRSGGASSEAEELESASFQELFETRLREASERRRKVDDLLEKEESADRSREP
ncbi:flagellar biosynthetic protein FliO [Saccharibacillus sp. CPCC 101409]|uniref:flagellar biosynthetic protein FliO n=1 Tax=Saccharibacillus sp. CPCC 101409 TaxID=3058041 RepID=UPI002671C30A|nr:flagellar biosynthetic protein FliO [Saccharibacillus sp. CPCC 101409]MDO3410689.1 flagellar biosynthetic protein FliO [Saccharibacillus sp. CPCC 101409]